MLIASLHIAQTRRSTGRLVASKEQSGSKTAWRGTVTASEPIVAMCFLHHGDQLYWARSPTRAATELPLSLLLAAATERESSSLYVTWSIGDCQTQICVAGATMKEPPVPIEREIVIGEPFHFADVAPSLSLFGLVLLKAQVKGKRNHLWALKDEYLAGIPVAWKEIMVRGRAGVSAYTNGA